MQTVYLICFTIAAYKIITLLEEISHKIWEIEYNLDKILKHTIEKRFNNDKLV